MKVTLILYILKKKLDKGRRLTSFNQNANPSIFAVNNWNDRYQDIIAAAKHSRDEKYSTLLPNSKRTATNKIINNTNNNNELNNLNNNINNNSNNNNDIKINKPNPKETIDFNSFFMRINILFFKCVSFKIRLPKRNLFN